MIIPRMTNTAASISPGAVRLDDWGVIRAKGEDAATFLHGQLTQDIQGLREGEVRLAGYCSPKGRLLASFWVWRPAPDEVLLACSADLLPQALKRLSMFVLRAKCKLSDASGELALWGIVGEALEPGRCTTADGAFVLGLPGALEQPRGLYVAPPSQAPSRPALERAAWDWLEVHSGVPRITAATVEQFVPQMVNFELLRGVNFQKGCYPGQEIVARSQYRGTLKRRTALFAVGAPALPAQEVFDPTDPGQPAGLVVNAASFGGRHAALVEVKLAALEAGALRLGTPDGTPLERLPLPYALIAPE
jgi:folate-binding protein YgfZ